MEKQKLAGQIGLVALALHSAICQAMCILCVSMSTHKKQTKNVAHACKASSCEEAEVRELLIEGYSELHGKVEDRLNYTVRWKPAWATWSI